jgi:hypothetical protein
MTDLTPTAGLDIGDRRTIKATITDSAGGAATVIITDVTITLRSPSGTETTPAGSVSNGVVSFTHKFDVGGWWYVRFAWDNGTNAETEEGKIKVRARW